MKKLFFLLCLALGMVSCEKDPNLDDLSSQLVVYTDYDKNAAFDSFQTYYLPDSILLLNSSKNKTYWSDENAQAIIQEVANNLNERGYVRITDPQFKSDADLGVQVSYLAQQTEVITGNYLGNWWNCAYWGSYWGGWYYPYPLTYSYNTNALVMELLNLTNPTSSLQSSNKLPVIWYANASGYKYGNSDYNLDLLLDAVDQAFEQSSYISANN